MVIIHIEWFVHIDLFSFRSVFNFIIDANILSRLEQLDI